MHALYNHLQVQKLRVFLWTPVFAAIGIGLYFFMSVEPPLWWAAVTCFVSVGLLALTWSRLGVRYAAVFLCLVTFGFLAAQLRTNIAHTPIIQKDIGPVMVEGTIRAIEDRGESSGSRLVLSDILITERPALAVPRKVRLRVRDDTGLRVGQRIEALAHLHKPSAPLIPGGFDFQRYLYFQGIGAVGFIYKDVRIINEDGVSFLSNRVEALRQHVAQVVEAYLPYPQAGLAMALSVGRKTAMSTDDMERMRTAGLAHVLAISGLHVGMFSGVVFFFVRLLLVCIPGLALHRPVKKYAAVTAILAACFYMLLAGATIPTQRALLMTGVVFLAIMLDRSPLSFRLVAFAALCVLFLFPESLLSASFHLSFAAVTGLIAFYDWLRPQWSAWYRQAGALRRTALYFAGISCTTIIATFATAPFALFHFNRLAVYGLIANLLCVPILGFLIMPCIVLMLFLLPFGGEALPLFLMDYGLQATITIASWIADMPYALFRAPSWPLSALILLVAGGLWFILWAGRLKVLALVFWAGAAGLIASYKLPDILIAPDIKLVAVQDEPGSLKVSTRRTARFAQKNWAEAYGLPPEGLTLWPKESAAGSIRCDEGACRIKQNGYTVSYLKNPLALPAECSAADAVISTVPLRDCTAPVQVDLFDVRYRGAHALWLNPDGVHAKNSEAIRGRRPWSRLNEGFQPFQLLHSGEASMIRP